VLVLFPLDHKLEQDALASLEHTTATARPAFSRLPAAKLNSRSPELTRVIRATRRRTGAEVFVFDSHGLLVDGTDVDAGEHFPEVAQALHRRRTVTMLAPAEGRRQAHSASPIATRGFLVLHSSLANLHGVEEVVRRSLVAAAFVALAVALLAGLALAARLVRRLAALRRTALQVAERGLGETPPVADDHRDEVGDLARAFATMQRRLAAQEQARRTFVSTASHELRTPLTSLGLMLHSATEDLDHGHPNLPEAREQVRRALGQTQRLTKLSEELLDLSRLDAGVELRAEPVELVELARSVLAEFDVVGGLHVELEAEGPTWASGDPGAIAQITRILVNNARSHGAAGARVVLRVDRSGPAIDVTDSGPGVAPGSEERIFERFERGPDVSEDGGFGLGLAIGRELARKMGGELVLVPGGPGATFRASFPATEDQA
jgi:signal transduction histidine kinase